MRREPTAVADWSTQRTFFVYTTVTYTITWSLWGLWATVAVGSSLAATVLFSLGGLGPFAASILLVQHTRQSVRSWLGRLFRVRGPARYYLLAVVLPAILVTVAGATHVLVFDAEVTPEAVPVAVEYPIFLGFVLLFGGGFEEPGWRGYLLPVLRAEYSALTSALLVGVVWAVWHLPLFFIPGSVQQEISPGLYLLQIIALSVALTWITNAVDGSVLPAMLLHAGGNTIVNYYPVGGVAGATSPVGLGLLVTSIGAFSVFLVLRYGLALDPSVTVRRF